MRKLKGTAALLTLLVFLLPSAAPAAEPPKGPKGWGVFLHAQFTARAGGVPASLMDHSLLDGARYSFNWSELEPREGQYDWQLIELVLKEWAARGKTVIVAVKTAQKGGHSPTAKGATPDWVFAAGAQKVVFTPKTGESKSETVLFPVFWDPVYLAKYDKFIKALAARYDGDPRIEYFEMGIGQGGALKITSDKEGWAAYKNQAKPPFTPERFVEAAKKVLDFSRAAFKKTPDAVFLNTFYRQKDGTEKKEMPEVARYAADRGIYLFSRSLDHKLQAMVERGFAQVFHELGPKTKTAFAYDFNLIKDPGKKKDHPLEGSIRDFRATMGYAIGGVAEPEAAAAAPGGPSEQRGAKRAERRADRNQRKGDAAPEGGKLAIPTTYLSYLFLLHRDASMMDPKNRSKGPLSYDKRIEDEVRKVRERLRKTLPAR